MKPANLVIRGQKLENPVVTDSPDQLQLEEVYVLSAATRGVEESHILRIDESKVAEFVFDDKTSWLTGTEGLEELFPEIAIKKRADEPFEIPATLANTSEQRGIADIAITMVRIFSKKKLGKGVRRLAEEFEQKNLDSKVGLYRVDSNFQLQSLNPFDQGKTYLLFLHGTASSTAGSFAGMKGTELWRFICQSYGDNILAFQHESITKSPLQNVRDLISLLPHDITLHIISHSRGGLIGDVLVRFSGNNVQSRGFSQEELSVLKKARRNDDIQCIAEIEKNLSGKNFIIEKFIRVACPAGGTILASGRLDIYFNIIANLTGLVTGLMGTPVYLAMKNLIAGVIDTKDDPEVLSGIEAMNPESPFIKILNNQSSAATVESALTVVSGNCGVNFSLRALKIIAVRLFFLESNDLVVNSRSMYLGAKRKGKIQYFYDDSDDVDHFHYFSNRKTGNAIQLALQAGAGATVPGFTSADQLSSDIASRNALLHPEGGELKSGQITGKRPIVVLLPGIMGSNIGRENELVWINFAGFVQGGLTELKHMDLYSSTSVVRTSYEKLKLFLEQYYDVEAWHYDWRQQLSTIAEKLNARVLELLQHNQPIKIIGHSMGGVLVRDFIVSHPDTWQKLNQSRGFRLLFLGAPLGGSYRIPYVLLGLDPIIRKLSLLDFRHDKRQLVEMFSQMEGLLSLLPLNGEHDFAQTETWQRICKASGNDDWPVPSPGLLQRFREHREKIKQVLKDSDFDNAAYIAGKDKSTPSGCNLDDPESPVFLSTAEGDQSVTWDSGIPKIMEERGQVYFVDVSHGSLAANTRLFKGIADILELGSTDLFSKKRPAVRTDAKVFKTPDVYDFDLSVRGLENTILGLGEETRMEIGETPLQVFVSNGDLGFASFPVIAGHFLNDGILNGERAIDYYLKWALTERHQLGLYPGEIGTCEILLTKDSTFKGGIIIGLGHLGSLTAYQLSRSVESATLKYLLDRRNNDTRKESRPGIGLSTLAIGCGYGGLSVESSLRAILQGIQNANNKMKQLHAENAPAIDTVEVVEQYEDKALDCFYALNAIE